MVASIIQIILAVMFSFSAAIKFLRAKTMVQHWNDYRYPFWFMYVTAVLETIGAMGMLAGFRYSEFLKYPAILIAVLMLGAIHAHLFRAKHNPYMSINALLMLCLSITLIVM